MKKTNESPITGIGHISLIHKEFSMRKLQIAVYANDQGSIDVTNSFLAAAKADDDLDPIQIPGLNIAVSDDARERLYQSDALVLGISSGQASGIEARLAAEALRYNPALRGRILFLEDFPGSSGVKDPDTRRVGQYAHLCSILPVSKVALERSVYQEIHTVGYPDHWVSDMRTIQTGIDLRSNDRLQKKRRGTTASIPVNPSDLVVYFSGFQQPDTEAKVLQRLLSIGKVRGRNVLVHFRAHPGERNRPELQSAIAARNALLQGQWEVKNPEVTDAGRSTNALLSGVADIIVAHPGTTSNFYMSPLRKKMICVMEFVSSAERASESYDYALTGRNTYLIDHLADLQAAITALTADDSPESVALRRKQKRNVLAFNRKSPPSYGKNVLRVLKNILE